MKAADLLVKALENEGVTHIFGVPGEENLDFLNSLKSSKIKLVVCRHEQSAGFMAATFGRLTGTAGVCLSTLGPGATNFLTAAAYAQLGGMPMLMITGQKPVTKSKQGGFQIIDTVQIMKPVTKFSKQVLHPEKIPSLVREAFRIAAEERPGAVHLELPEDIAAQTTDAELFEVTEIRRPIAEAKAIDRAVEMIEKAHRPLILIGAGANRKQVAKMLTEFIEKTKIPFFTTQMGKGVVAENHQEYLGCAALSENDYVHCAIDAADLIINVGHDTIEKPPFIMKRNGCQVIHLNFSQASIDQIYFPQLEVVGDIANALWQLKERITVSAQWDFSYYLKIKELFAKQIELTDDLKRYPLTPQQIVNTVQRVVENDAIVTLDNGMYKIWFARNFLAARSNALLLDNALATMGAGLPSAIAAKLLYPNRQVIAVCGDGGFMMNSQELETAVRLGIDLTIVIINDNGYGMIKWKQHAMKFDSFGLDYGNPDFVAYAKSYGVNAYKIQSSDEFEKILKKSLDEKGITLIEVPVDYSENKRVFDIELKNKNCPVFK